MMIVKFHPRDAEVVPGRWILLGKDRQREGASVLQGKPEEVRELIDASPSLRQNTLRRPVLCRKFTARPA